MAIQFVAVGALSNVTTSPATVPAIPAGTVEGDLMLLFCFGSMGGVPPSSWEIPSGWLQRLVHPGTAPSTMGLEIFYKIAGASESSPSITVDQGTVSNSYGTFIATYRGVDPATPFGLPAALDDQRFASATFTTAGVTTLTDNSFGIVFVHQEFNNAISFFPGEEEGFTARAQGAAYSSGANPAKHAIMLVDKFLATAGATGGPRFKRNGGFNVQWYAWYDELLEFIPPPPSTGPPKVSGGLRLDLGRMMGT